MKKFFALFMVIALLAFTGSAFAANPTITFNPTSVTVTQGATATARVSATAGNDGGTLGAFSVTGGTASAWTTLSGTTLTFAPAATVTPGSYTATVSVTESYTENPGHSATQEFTGTATINITVEDANPLTAFTVTPTTAAITTVETATFTLAAEGGDEDYRYSSATDGVTVDGSSATFTSTTPGEYELSFTVTDGASRTLTTTATVTVTYPTFTLAASPATTTATVNGEAVSITLTPTGAVGTVTYAYTVSPTAGATVTMGEATEIGTATATFTATEAGTYEITFTATDTIAAGTTDTEATTRTARATTTVTVAQPSLAITATASATTITLGNSVTIELAATGNLGEVSYVQTTAVEGVTFGTSSATFTPTETGTFTITFRGTDAGGTDRTADATVIITVTNPDFSLSATASPASITRGSTSTITLTPTGAIGAVTYAFSPSDNISYTSGNTATFTGSVTGTSRIEITATDSQERTATASVEITVTAPAPDPISITFDASSTTIMATTPVTITLNASGGTGAKTFDSPRPDVSINGNVATFTPTADGNYELVFTATDEAGVTAEITVSIRVEPVLTLTAAASAYTVVVNRTVTIEFTATGGVGDKTFSTTTPMDGLTVGETSATFTPRANGTYTLVFRATDTQDNTADSNQVIIDVRNPLTFSVTPEEKTTFLSRQVTFTLTARGGIGDKSFTSISSGVDIADAGTNTTTSATFTPSATGVFELIFTASDTPEQSGAEARATVTVEPDPVEDEQEQQPPETEDEKEDVGTQTNSDSTEVTKSEIPSDLVTNITEESDANMKQDASDAINNDNSYSEAEKELGRNTTTATNNAVGDARRSGRIPDRGDASKNAFRFNPRDENAQGTMSDTVAKDRNEKGQTGGAAAFLGMNLDTNDGIPEGGATVTATLDRQPEGFQNMRVHYMKNGIKNTGGGGHNFHSNVGAAADDVDEVSNKDAIIFFDSNGNITEVIPGPKDEEGNDRIGGFMTMATYVEPNTTYDIILSIPTEEIEAKGDEALKSYVAENTTTETVELPDFHSSETSFFSTFVEADIIAGTAYYRISEDAIASKYNVAHVGDDWARDADELELATKNHYTLISRLALLDATDETTTHTYIVAVNFSSDKIEKLDTSDTGGFVFYPKGPANDPVAARVLSAVQTDDGYSFEEITPEEIRNGLVTRGYLTFELPAGDTFDKPMLAAYTEVVKATPKVFTLEISKPSLTLNVDSEDTAELTPDNASGDVDYVAYNKQTETKLDWITFNANIATFKPTAAGTYYAYIEGTDKANKVASVDVTVIVNDKGTPVPTPGTLTLTADSPALNIRVGATESTTLRTSGLQGDIGYVLSGDVEKSGANISNRTTNGTTATATISFTPTAKGVYPIEITVTDSGRTAPYNTDSTVITVTATQSSSGGNSVGSSSGGCSAGWSVLALALLGGLIARKK